MTEMNAELLARLVVSHEEVHEALFQLNHRPRKCLGYRTPHEVFFGLEIQPITLTKVSICS